MASVVSMTSMLEWVQLNRTNRYIISQKEMHKDKGNFLPCSVKECFYQEHLPNATKFESPRV